MRASWITLPVALVVVAASAAGAGEAGCNQIDHDYVTSDQFAAEYAQALCTSLQPCCVQNGITQDYGACTQGWQAQVQTLVNGAVASGNYDITAATNCVQQVRAAAAAGCGPGPGTLSAARATCQSVFAGQLPLGAACTSVSQCAQMDGSVVTCAVPPQQAPDASTTGGQLPLAATGTILDGLSVSIEDTAVCVTVPPSDAGTPACAIQADAGTDTCESQGAYCDPTALTCQPLNSAGGLCDPAVASSCAAGNYCVTSGAAKGTCAAANPVGSTCTNAAQCAPPGVCDVANTQKCIPVLNPGQSCNANFECSIGVCDPGTSTCLTNAIATTAACNGTITTP